MDRADKRTGNEDEFQRFRRQLYMYDDSKLGKIYEYFREDLIYIMESLDTHRLLSELKSHNIPELENYLGASLQAGTLLDHILNCGRGAIIGFWESLYALHCCCPHPSLAALLSEIIERSGETLMDNILLDEYGDTLITELKEIQSKHREHLQQETQNLTENKPPGTTDGQKHFYILNRYVNLAVVSTHHFRQSSQGELTKSGETFEGCLQKSKSRLQNVALNRLLHWCHRSKRVPNIAMVSGAAGIGKSTLIQKFVYDWVNKKHYQRFSFVFSFKFRQLNRLTEVSLEKMILDQYPHLDNHLDKILEDPKTLLFIFDGLDESIHHLDFNSCKFCTSTKERFTVGMIVVGLLEKTLLKGCSVLLTSRPTKLSSIASDVFERIVAVMGFSAKEKQTYFENFYQGKELKVKAFQYVRENDSLYTFCYIPSYCWIVCKVLSMCLEGQPTHKNQLMLLPKTLTQLFAIFVAHTLSNHTEDTTSASEVFRSVGKMAEHGIANGIIIFDQRYLESFQVERSSHLTSCFMTESDETKHVTCSFIHIIFQEFFASLIYYLPSSPKNPAELLDEEGLCPTVHGEMFFRFICGLSDSSTRAILRPYLGELSKETSRQVIDWLVSILKSEMLEDYKSNKKRLQNLFFYLFESRNKSLVSETLKTFKCFEFFRVHHTPLNCAVLAFVLDCCEEVERLHLNECYVRSEGLERLKPVLHTIKDISLCTNDLKDSAMDSLHSALTHDQCKIQKLNLSDNSLSSSSCTQLASAVGGNRTLRALDLSYNCLLGAGFKELITNLSSPRCQIEEMSLRGIGLKNSSCPQLASIINNNQALRKFDLSYNNLEGPNFADVVASLSSPSCSLEELLLRYTGLSDTSLIQLASGISHNQSLRRLDLSENKLAGDHFGDFMAALSSPSCRIEELKLCGINMIDEQVPLLVQLSNNRSLKYLEFSSKAVSDKCAGYIMELIRASSSLQEIRLDIETFSAESKESLKGLENLRPELKIFIW